MVVRSALAYACFAIGFALPVAGAAHAREVRIGHLSVDTDLAIFAASPAAPEARLAPREEARVLDYGLFSRELLAYVAKEALPEAGDEYPRASIPSRLSEEGVFDSPSPERGRFGVHCLLVLDRVTDGLFGEDDGTQAPLARVTSAAARTTATVFVLRDLWSAVRSHRDDDGRGEGGDRRFSLEPRLSGRKVEARFVIRW